MQTDDYTHRHDGRDMFSANDAGYNWVDEMDVSPASSHQSGFERFGAMMIKNAGVATQTGGSTGRNDAVINTGVEAPGQLVEEGSSTMRVKRIVDSSEILSQYHRDALYLEQDIRFLEHKLGCEMKELKELRKTFDDWGSRMKKFRMVSQCDSFTQVGSTDMPEQHPT